MILVLCLGYILRIGLASIRSMVDAADRGLLGRDAYGR